MEQWKLILSALMLTLFLPLLLWTGLFAFFGWKLFLFVFLGTGALLLFGEKLTKLPLFKSAVRWLLPFAMTARFYRALLAGKEVRDKEGGAVGAWWTTFRQLLQEELSTQEQIKETSGKQEQSKESTQKQELVPVEESRNSATSSEFDDTASASSNKVLPGTPQRFQPPTEAELELRLLELKTKMKKKRELESES